MSSRSESETAHVVITGASSGIGEALAREFARRGDDLILVARRRDRLEAIAHELMAAFRVKVDMRECDLANRDARSALAHELGQLRISALCNNAGFAPFGAIDRLDPAREAEEVELNVVAVHELTLAVLPGMIARRKGSILIVGSTAGHQPMPGSATYAATKAFANTFAESLHSELEGTGVTCTLLAPGPVRTGFAAVAGIGRMDHVGGNFVWLSADRVAREAIAAMDARRRLVVPGMFAKLETIGGRYTPRAVLLPIVRGVLRKIA